MVGEFCDAAVSGAAQVDQREQFAALLAHCAEHGISVVVVENVSHFARDLAVQVTGHDMLQSLGIELVVADAPTYFTNPTPTAVMIRQILGNVAQLEKASLVAKLRGATERIKVATGKCGGRNPMLFGEALAMARRLHRKNPKTVERRSLRAIAAELAEALHLKPTTKKPFSGEAIRLAMLSKPAAKATKETA